MKKALTLLLLGLGILAGLKAAPPSAALDTVYRYYVAKAADPAYALLQRLAAEAKSPADQFITQLEIGDFLLDKRADPAGAEAVYAQLLEDYPKHRLVPDVLYRLALAQEKQERFLDAAKNYEKVATRYSKSPFGADALDAIERCFRKNYQDRVAYVDSFPLTRIEIDDRISRNPTAYEKYEKKQQLLDTMIDNRLLYAAALAAGVARDSALVFNLNEQRNRAMFQEWYERAVTSQSEPSEKELKAAYKKDLATKYTTPEKVHAYQLQVATRAEADRLRRQLLADTTIRFDSVAKEVSTAPDQDKGGDLGLFARGSQPKAIEQAAFRLKPGEVSQPVAVTDGFVLVKVTERKPKTVRSYADVRNQLAADRRQQNSSQRYEKAIAELKKQANLFTDTTAIEQNKETLAVVNGMVIDQADLEARLNTIPPFYRSQFETPDGKRRILDNLILERLMLREAETAKLWLVNKVVDQLLTRRAGLLIEAYRRAMTTDQVQLDSNKLKAEYKATLSEFKEPTKVHAREIAAGTRARAEQLRNWAVSGRLPALLQGRALLFSTPEPELESGLAAANPDSLLGEFALAGPPALLSGRPMVGVGSKNVPDLSRPTTLTGPYVKSGVYGLGFNDLSRQDKLYQPELVSVERLTQLDSLLGKPPRAEGDDATAADSIKLGTYVKLNQALPASFVSGLFQLGEKAVSSPLATPAGNLVVKLTKKDTAQKA
ncbi:hypothetical protein FJY70_00600, partial [candidate division WOR-3 bacterium]|nr:hypothetical protein [candidate division WOR-3 bacterium]